MKWRELERSLKEQNFIIESTTSGYLVKAPPNVVSANGETSTSFHTNAVGRDEIGPTILSNLSNIGWRDPQGVKREEVMEKREEKKKEFPCRWCNDTFQRAAAKGRHESAMHPEQWAEEKAKDEAEKAVGRDARTEAKGVRVRYQQPQSPAVRVANAARAIQGAMKTINENAEIIQTEVAQMYEELEKLRGKVKKLEGILGRAVDAL